MSPDHAVRRLLASSCYPSAAQFLRSHTSWVLVGSWASLYLAALCYLSPSSPGVILLSLVFTFITALGALIFGLDVGTEARPNRASLPAEEEQVPRSRQSTQPCFALARSGRCPLGRDCPFSHDVTTGTPWGISLRTVRTSDESAQLPMGSSSLGGSSTAGTSSSLPVCSICGGVGHSASLHTSR